MVMVKCFQCWNDVWILIWSGMNFLVSFFDDFGIEMDVGCGRFVLG